MASEQPAPIAPHEAEDLLCSATFEDMQSVWNSSNYVFLCQMLAADGRRFRAIYKPLRGESPLDDFPSGTLYRREVAAYRLAALLGWPVVPPTVVRDGPHGIGALQLFIAHDPAAHFFVQREDPALQPQLKRLAVFDMLANNADRKAGHCLLDPQGNIWGIDHGICFHDLPKLRTVIWDWADEPIAADLLADLVRLRDCLADDDARFHALFELLSPAEELAFRARLDAAIAAPRLPRPGPWRPYPWPLI